jgi:hypothetical protein
VKKIRCNFLIPVSQFKALRQLAKRRDCTMTDIVLRGLVLAMSEQSALATGHLGEVPDSSFLHGLIQK